MDVRRHGRGRYRSLDRATQSRRAFDRGERGRDVVADREQPVDLGHPEQVLNVTVRVDQRATRNSLFSIIFFDPGNFALPTLPAYIPPVRVSN